MSNLRIVKCGKCPITDYYYKMFDVGEDRSRVCSRCFADLAMRTMFINELKRMDKSCQTKTV